VYFDEDAATFMHKEGATIHYKGKQWLQGTARGQIGVLLDYWWPTLY